MTKITILEQKNICKKATNNYILTSMLFYFFTRYVKYNGTFLNSLSFILSLRLFCKLRHNVSTLGEVWD
jgi:hypothetical protein